MDEVNGSGPTRTTFLGAIAHRDHIVDGLRRMLRDVLGSVMTRRPTIGANSTIMIKLFTDTWASV